jgi:hypothetical protein
MRYHRYGLSLSIIQDARAVLVAAALGGRTEPADPQPTIR